MVKLASNFVQGWNPYYTYRLAAYFSILFYLLVIDIFSSSLAWSGLKKAEDPELKKLAQLLPTIALAGKAPSTVKKYSGAFLRWKNQKSGVVCFPAKPFQVTLYLAFLLQKSETSAPVEKAVNAISWVHQQL